MPTKKPAPPTEGRTVVRHEITDETADKVVDMYVNQGAKLSAIVEATGVPRSSIYWILQKKGADPNRQGTRRSQDGSGESLRWAMERVEELATENAVLKAQLAEAHSALVAAMRGKA